MNMRDGDTGKLKWQSDNWGSKLFREEIPIHIPGVLYIIILGYITV